VSPASHAGIIAENLPPSVPAGYVPAQQFNVVELRPADRTNY
jgi:hypothetical protein